MGSHDKMTPEERRQRKHAGILCIAIAMFLLLMAFDLIPLDRSGLHAPVWVLCAAGLVFAAGGGGLIAEMGSPLQLSFVAMIVGGLGLIGGWVSLFGDSRHFSGGVPFVPASFNISLARLAFGLGSLICLFLLGLIGKSILDKIRSGGRRV